MQPEIFENASLFFSLLQNPSYQRLIRRNVTIFVPNDRILQHFLEYFDLDLDSPELDVIIKNHIALQGNIAVSGIKLIFNNTNVRTEFDKIQLPYISTISYQGATYHEIEGVLMTKEQQTELFGEIESSGTTEEVEEPEVIERKPSGLVEIKGNPNVRQKIHTKQIKKEELPKTKRTPGRKITEKEREYMLAKRREVLGAEEVRVPSAPKRLTPLSSEEVSRRHANILAADRVTPTVVVSENKLIHGLPNKPGKLGRILEAHDYQLRVVRYLMKNRGIIAVHSVGSGKTLIAAICTQVFLKNIPNLRVFFIGPKSLLTNYENTLKFNFNDVEWNRIILYTYEKFQLDHAKGEIDCGGVFLIVDEAHRLRTSTTSQGITTPGKTTKAVLQCARKAVKVLLLTATPVVNKPYDIVNLVAIIKGDLTPMSQKQFNTNIVSKKGAIVSMSALNNFFRCTVSFYTRPQDETYPTVNFHTVNIRMTSQYFEEYLRVENQNITDLQRDVLGESDLEPFYNGRRRTVNADIEELNPKLDWVRKHLLQYNNRKMVIFSPFISLGVRQLEKLVQDFDVKPIIAEIIGDDPAEKRQRVIDEFNADKIQVLLISIGAGGLGIDLRGTRDVVLMQPGWNEVEQHQALSRAVRYLSHSHLPPDQRFVDVWQLLLVKPLGFHQKDSVDELIMKIIERKNKIIEPFMKLLEVNSIEHLNC